MSAETPPACFALFDDCHASADDPRSRLYTGYIGTLQCRDKTELVEHLDHLQRRDTHAVALCSYELGAALHDIPGRSEAPLTQLILFDHCTMMSTAAVDAWLLRHADHASAGVAGLQANLDADSFTEAIGRIHDYIAAGDTYQVNFTYRLHFETYGNLFTLYCRLRARQPVPYGALICLTDGSATLSLSPELFVRQHAGNLTVRPMKGTARATGDATRDIGIAAALANDPKNRAENLMIVDLLRNDLGQVARIGSVTVPELFAVTRFGSVLQMTSTVTARLRDDVTLAQLIVALFPCGSITGAPKRRTMQIIRELEEAPRGLYTGAIGWLAPAQQPGAIGDFCLSVPIRTLLLQAPDAAHMRRGEMGVGAGIVHDSVAADEWAECALKAQFLTGLVAEFALFETMAVSRDGGCRSLSQHLARLSRSARYFGFEFDPDAARLAVGQCCAGLPDTAQYRLRLTLQPDGTCALQSGSLTPLSEPVRLLVSPDPTNADDLFLRHKTTLRTRYDRAWQDAEAQGAFDQLFCNQRGEVTEGGRSTLLVQIDDRWWTPALACGVLPGVMRAELLVDPVWQVCERRMTLTEVRGAQRLLVCNALRGMLEAVLVG